MSAKSEKILRDFTQSLTQPKGTSAYDTTAKVLRVENGTAWVHIPGGVDETPVKLTIDAKAGDEVQVRVSGGRAFIVGNATAPPTDDAEALVAKVKAKIADETAKKADTKATEAKEIAVEAGEAVAEVIQHFWTDENGAHITETTQEEFIEEPIGGNTLITSDGMSVRNGTDVLSSFGSYGARIGKDGEARTIIGADNIAMFTPEGVEAFKVGVSATSSSQQVTELVNIKHALSYLQSITEDIDKIDDVANAETFVLDFFLVNRSNDGGMGFATIELTKGTAETITKTVTIMGLNKTVTLQFDYTPPKTIDITYTTGSDTSLAVNITTRGLSYTKVVRDVINEVAGEMIWKSPADVFVVERYTKAYSNISSGGNFDWDETVTKAGYYPVAMAGFNSYRATLSVDRAYIYDRAVGSCGIRMHARAQATASAGTAFIEVLWVKAE